MSQLQVRTELQTKLELVKTKLNELEKVTEGGYRTNCEFRFNPAFISNSPIRIDRIVDISVLISILGAIKGHYEKYNDAAKELRLESYPNFTWCGYTFEDWTHDIKMRTSIITHHTRKQKLAKAKATLESFLTEEDRLALALKELDNI